MQTLHVAFLIFDLRDEATFNAGHIKGAFNLPAENFLSKVETVIPSKETPVVLYDGDGVQAAAIVAEADKLGFLNFVNLEGGYRAYVALFPT